MCQIIYCRNLVHFITLWKFQGLLKFHLSNLTLYHGEVPLVKCLHEVLDGEAEEVVAFLVSALVCEQWTATQQGGGCLSVCLLLSCTEVCHVLGSTAGASMDVALQRWSWWTSSSLAHLSARWLPKGGLLSRGCSPLHFLWLSPACCFCGHINMEQLKSLSWLWASLCWMCSWLWRPLLTHRQGCEPWRGAAPGAQVCLLFLPCCLQHIQILHLTFLGFSLLDSLSLCPTGIILLSLWVGRAVLFCKLMVCLH